jgi:hypothetical protein
LREEGKREEGRGKREEGRGKREEGREQQMFVLTDSR